MVRVCGLNLACMREIVARTDILAQASLSRFGENSRSWPKFLLELSLRQRVFILSEVSSRSGERGSPK